jgi:hypothetical protein
MIWVNSPVHFQCISPVCLSVLTCKSNILTIAAPMLEAVCHTCRSSMTFSEADCHYDAVTEWHRSPCLHCHDCILGLISSTSATT